MMMNEEIKEIIKKEFIIHEIKKDKNEMMIGGGEIIEPIKQVNIEEDDKKYNYNIIKTLEERPRHPRHIILTEEDEEEILENEMMSRRRILWNIEKNENEMMIGGGEFMENELENEMMIGGGEFMENELENEMMIGGGEFMEHELENEMMIGGGEIIEPINESKEIEFDKRYKYNVAKTLEERPRNVLLTEEKEEEDDENLHIK